MKHILHVFKIEAGVEDVPQLLLKLSRMLSDTSIQVHKIPIEIVEYFKISTGVLMEQYPSTATKHFDIALVIQGKAGDDLISQGFFAAHPGHKTIDSLSPPFGGMLTPISSALPVF